MSSKRRSSTKPLPEHTFFTDRDLGRRFPTLLRDAGISVEQHDDHFPPLTPDVEWLRVIGERGWIALSHNRDIRYNPEERDMAMRAGVPLFFLIGHTSHALLALNFINSLERVLKFLDDHEPPFIARIYRPSPVEAVKEGKPGKVQLWLAHSEWLSLISAEGGAGPGPRRGT